MVGIKTNAMLLNLRIEGDREFMSMAKIAWSKENERFELIIEGKLKAYTQDDHAAGKKEMVKMVEDKGYTVFEQPRD